MVSSFLLCAGVSKSPDNYCCNACHNTILISAVADCQSKTSMVSLDFQEPNRENDGRVTVINIPAGPGTVKSRNVQDNPEELPLIEKYSKLL